MVQHTADNIQGPYASIAFLIGLCLLCFSIFLNAANKDRLSLAFLLGAAFFLFCFAAAFNPFLNLWDERFHALVAKNLMHHPLLPTLYEDPVVTMDYHENWARYHIWLHKQPLFMWQMALSYCLFGVNELAMRLPNVLLGCAMVYAAYRAGTILGNKRTGYFTAILTATSLHLLLLLSGGIEVDQNDFSFIAYISLSLWCWLEYVQSGKTRWIILIGLFSGCALLCKWLAGLLVYFCWGLVSVYENRFHFKKYRDIGMALFITALLFVPWQIFIWHEYPQEARAALEFNVHHFTAASDGRLEDLFYHFFRIPKNFGTSAPYLILPALGVFYWKTRYKTISLSLMVGVLFVYLFFTLAITKMPCFTSIVVLPVFLSIAFLADLLFSAFEKLKLPTVSKKLFLTISLLLFFAMRLNVAAFFTGGSFPGPGNRELSAALCHDKAVFQKIKLPANTVLFNVPGKQYIEAMYYTGLPAYGFIPSEEQHEEMKHKNRRIALFVSGKDSIPTYLEQDKSLILLKDTILVRD